MSPEIAFSTGGVRATAYGSLGTLELMAFLFMVK